MAYSRRLRSMAVCCAVGEPVQGRWAGESDAQRDVGVGVVIPRIGVIYAEGAGARLNVTLLAWV